MTTDANNGAANIVTIRPDGSDVRRLTHLSDGGGAFIGSYSPDGKRLVARLEHDAKYDIATMEPSGKAVRVIFSSEPVKPRFLDWGR